jgi:hypothetical protein
MCFFFVLIYRELLYQGGGGHPQLHPHQHQHHPHHHQMMGGSGGGGPNRVSGLLINTGLESGSSCYSSPNHYSPSTKSLNMNNAAGSGQQSPVMYHPGYNHHHHHHHHPPREESGVNKDNLATEV